MPKQFETRSIKVRGMARKSLELIEAMQRKQRSRSPAGVSATSCSPPA
jgi:hypothetical protein